MPEGHTIHRLARDLAKDLVGHRLAASSPQGRFAAGAAQIDGEVLERTEAFGKHLFLHWADGRPLHIHLGLFGRHRRRPTPPPEPRGELRLRLVGPDHTWDLSGPTACDLLDPGEYDDIVDRLGPDPLRSDADPDRFVDRVTSSRAAMGTLLLNQKVIAGVGNVYRAELLFLTGLHPRRQGKSVNAAEVLELWQLTAEQLRRGVKLKRIVTRDPLELGLKSAAKIKKADRLYLYKRSQCRRCLSDIESFELANRTTWACPTCQPE